MVEGSFASVSRINPYTDLMAGSRKWMVESKEFELVIKGGNTGVRFFERNSRNNRSIFLQRAEVKWLDSVVETLLAVTTSEVFWDQSRAGYPRVIAQKCSNRHGKFLTIEEFDGRRRCGSVMILFKISQKKRIQVLLS